MERIITDIDTWFLEECEGKVFRFLIYKKVFTPYEQQNAYQYESIYESEHYSFGVIQEAAELSNGDWLIGFNEVEDGELTGIITYYRLSEIRLFYFKDELEDDNDV